MKWFRFYDEVVDDPKVQLLPDRKFKTWVSLLCLASRNGGRLPAAIKDVAYALRCTERQASSRVDEMIEAGLFEREGLDLVPHNWNARQYKSDDSKERVAALRKRRSNGDGNGHVTPSETEAEQNRTEAEADAKVLPPIALAQKVADELRLRGPGMIPAIAEAIADLVKNEGKSNDSAVEFLIAHGKDALHCGVPLNRFWFDEGKWRATKPKEFATEGQTRELELSPEDTRIAAEWNKRRRDAERNGKPAPKLSEVAAEMRNS